MYAILRLLVIAGEGGGSHMRVLQKQCPPPPLILLLPDRVVTPELLSVLFTYVMCGVCVVLPLGVRSAAALM